MVAGAERRVTPRIPQAEAKAVAVRLLQHRLMESAARCEFEVRQMPRIRTVRRPVPDAARGRLWNALNGRCGICGQLISQLSEVTYDHVVPIARGGGNYGNLVPAHSACNGTKADRMPTGCERLMLDVVNTTAGNVLVYPPAKGRQLADALLRVVTPAPR